MRTTDWGRRFAAAAVLATAAMTLAPTADATGAAEPRTGQAAHAIEALTTTDTPLDAIPADFSAVLGYRPAVVDGMLANPEGECSSPVTLPVEFDGVCKAHDLGYDLLRYADLTGEPLGPWAREAVDAKLGERFDSACDTRTGMAARVGCHAMAHIAGGFVDVNSWRQGYSTPGPEPVWTYVAAGTLGAACLALAWVLRPRRASRFALALEPGTA
ncbi:hypothetical protein [Antrihabitans sp. YC2-6]|uniref:hypothetical protein n=1 Tax=Antrihabitans sp. YC2-6 TaxID=2799498 RepID=UPI0018F69B9B|nr:hypothetical protein [Antrihabitans sp. YC2-6]MBJ8343430.1 hypothetical protein [Antrihabitans sp. YC2-6]